MKIRIAAVLGLALAACSEAPTGVTPAAAPHLDSGYVIGSGNRAGGDSVAVQGATAGTNEKAANANGVAADGGYVIGSGN
jgi:hypothetical protein